MIILCKTVDAINKRNRQLVLYQEEHSGLHDLSGQLLQYALFQEDLEDKNITRTCLLFHGVLVNKYDLTSFSDS